MGFLVGTLGEVVALVKAAGIPAVSEPADAVLPGAIIYPNLLDFDRLDARSLDLTVDVLLVASGLNTTDALNQLDDLIVKLREAFTIGELSAVTVTLPSQSSDPLPAFQTTLIVSVSYTESDDET